MRDALRTALKAAIPELTEVYDPYVPTPKTPKPYAVIVRGSDNQNDKSSFGRNVEIWIYYDIGQLDELDKAVEKVIQGLHYKTIVNPNTGESFTAEVKGTIGTDEQDEDWQAIFRGISLSFVTLYHQVDAEPWEIALKNFLSEKLNIKAYAGQWTTDFLIPSSKELTGYSEDVAIGALLNCKKNELSIDEFNTEIKTFLKKEVK